MKKETILWLIICILCFRSTKMNSQQVHIAPHITSLAAANMSHHDLGATMICDAISEASSDEDQDYDDSDILDGSVGDDITNQLVHAGQTLLIFRYLYPHWAPHDISITVTPFKFAAIKVRGFEIMTYSRPFNFAASYHNYFTISCTNVVFSYTN